MKKIIVIILAVLTLSGVRSSAQTLIDYAAVVKNGKGQPIAGNTLRLLVTVRDYLDPTRIVYRETQTVTTSRIGKFDILIGRGAPPAGKHYSPHWVDSAKLVKVDIAIAGVPAGQSNGLMLQCVKMRKNYNMVFGSGAAPVSQNAATREDEPQ